MEIKDRYESLINQKSMDQLASFVDLRKEALKSDNMEYYYLCGLKIADIYVDRSMINNAIEILTKDIEKIDIVTFKSIYVAYLERAIYAYIKKGSYKLAYKYIFEKRKYIDDFNHDEINRWYMEMAYVYGEMGQPTKALNSLNAILENIPSDEALSYALSNITKIYIDEKQLEEAKVSLQKCLKVVKDEEGLKYCDYLLAKVLLLEGNFSQAIELFGELFKNDTNINEDYLGIANEYINILIEHKEKEKAQDLLRRLGRVVSHSNDLEIKKNFLINKVKQLALSLELDGIIGIVEEVERLDKSINALDSENMIETLEDEKDYEVNSRIKNFTDRLSKIISLNKLNFDAEELRDNIYSFYMKLDSIISFEESGFVLFNNDNLLSFTEDNYRIKTYDYHHQRLYERNIDYSSLDGSILEKILFSKDSVMIDLTSNAIPLVDYLTKKTLKEEGINYALAFPFSKDNELLFALTFQSKIIDLTSLENEALMHVASIILVNKIKEFLDNENLKLMQKLFNNLDYHNFTMFHYEDKLYLNRTLATLLGYKVTDKYYQLPKCDYVKFIYKGDVDGYISSFDLANSKDDVKVAYTLRTKNKMIDVVENSTFISYFGKELYFSILTLPNVDSEAEETIITDQMKFNSLLESIKPKLKDIEFKFSFLRIVSPLNKDRVKSKIKEVTGANAYYLDDESFACILINEVNQKTLDRYNTLLGFDMSIIRYPRDLINLDDCLKLSKICLDMHQLYFSDDVYQSYLRKENTTKMVLSALNNDPSIALVKLNHYNTNKAYEVRLNIPGITVNTNIRKELNEECLKEYESILFSNFNTTIKDSIFYMPISFAGIAKLVSDNALVSKGNLLLVIDGYKEEYSYLIPLLKEMQIKYILEYKSFDMMPFSIVLGASFSGLAIYEGMELSYRDNLIAYCIKMNLPLYTNYQFADYDKCIYCSDEVYSLKGIVNDDK